MPRNSKFYRPPADEEIEPREKFLALWRPAPSLNPGITNITRCVEGDAEAIAIRDAWSLSHPIKVLSRKRYADLVARTEGVYFEG